MIGDIIVPQNKAPEIIEATITNVKSTGYTVTCKIRDDGSIDRISMPTWTEKNGQDDIKWYVPTVKDNGDGTYDAVYTVSINDHKKESGKYNTHIYVYDEEGLMAFKGLVATIPEGSKPEISEVKVSTPTRNGYTVTCKITSDTKITKVEMPTWTEKKGQDDLVFHSASISDNGDGTYTASCEIKTSDHNKESGAYITHIYAYNNSNTGTYVISNIIIPNVAPTIVKVEKIESNSNFYTIEITARDDCEVAKVLVPTWTTANGQDDIVWHSADLNNGKWVCVINRKDHNFEYGDYLSHIYVYDNDDTESIYYDLGIITLEEPEDDLPHIMNVKISDADDDGYTITCQVNSKQKIDRVSFPTWTYKNGQDDLIWYDAISIGEGVYSCRIKREQHNYEFGTYITHIYAYNDNDNYSCIVLNYHNIVNTTVANGWTYIKGQKYFFDNKGNIAGNMPSKKIIDVSLYNGTIDWETVSKYGDIDGAILRITAHPNGNYVEDSQFANNLAGCRKYNIPFGIYIYDYSNNSSDAYYEADLVVSILKKYNVSNKELSYPVYFDMERDVVSTEQNTINAKTFINRMSEYGYKANIYSYRSLLNGTLNDQYIWSQTSWMAAYTDEIGWSNPYYHGNFGWQYTSGGSIPGIEGYVDISCWYEV